MKASSDRAIVIHANTMPTIAVPDADTIRSVSRSQR